ncbi:putative ribonuclease H-like domain-containing protein [Tanacetum coccineum]|uniref:Ribonuclease H-like domain-containing protein n=1 Tax=Tanacetum coccineum TaxID=301880 RepID=A0ABQ5ATL2_9ASTR
MEYTTLNKASIYSESARMKAQEQDIRGLRAGSVPGCKDRRRFVLTWQAIEEAKDGSKGEIRDMTQRGDESEEWKGPPREPIQLREKTSIEISIVGVTEGTKPSHTSATVNNTMAQGPSSPQREHVCCPDGGEIGFAPTASISGCLDAAATCSRGVWMLLQPTAGVFRYCYAAGVFGFYCNLQQGCLYAVATCSKGVWMLLQPASGVFGYRYGAGMMGLTLYTKPPLFLEGCLDAAATCSRGVWMLLQPAVGVKGVWMLLQPAAGVFGYRYAAGVTGLTLYTKPPLFLEDKAQWNWYHAVSHPYTGNFIPPKPNLILADEEEYVFSESKPKSVSKPLIEDRISDSKDENETEFKSKQRKPSFAKIEFVKSNEHVKTPRESVKKVESNKQAKYPRKNSESPRGNKRNWNNLMTQKLGSNFEFKNKACYVCGSFNHLIKDYDFYEKKIVEKPVWNNARRVNHQNSQRMNHPHPKRNFVPRVVLMKSGLKTLNTPRQNSSRAAISVNIVRPINTAYPRPTVNSARTTLNVFNRAHSHVRRPFNKFTTNNNNNFKEKVNTVRKNVTTVRPKAVVSDNKGNEANVIKASACWVRRPDQKVLDHLELEKGVIDSGCSRHMTGNKSYLLDYEEIDGGFVAFGGNPKEGKITGKVVLSPDFKLLDESQVLLRVPRKNNMYSVDLKNVVPSGGLTCLFTKATLDESNLWHRRRGHINFKTMNKLVKGNLVRGLPSKFFENNHTCVACQKGKQHKASCKTKTVSLISQPLQMLHMDLFGLTFVKSIMKKIYCLVVTDDFSRFSWVFFLATKDETSEILKAFITRIENQINHRVKIIRCDNGTEFKNKEMNQFCEMNVIKSEFSVARTPQQNGVAERKNITLIEAARTMLANSKLPSTFWAEAVNTACKFDGKADEGFFVGYSVNSKAFRVFNSRTRIVEETLHITFLENKPNVARSGPEWLFDIDTLKKSMNYEPVVAGNQTNGNTGTKESIDAGQAGKKTVPSHKYILLPLWTPDSPISLSPKRSDDEVADDAGKKTTNDLINEGNKDDQDLRDEFEREFKSSPINIAGTKDADDEPMMPNLEDTGIFGDAYDDEDFVAGGHMNNLESSMSVSPVATTRVHKYHPVE